MSFTDGKIYVPGEITARGTRKRADYILYYKPNIPIAIIEAKDNKHSVRAGIQQGLEYARILDIPCVFSSNGYGFLLHDRTIKKPLRINRSGFLRKLNPIYLLNLHFHPFLHDMGFISPDIFIGE